MVVLEIKFNIYFSKLWYASISIKNQYFVVWGFYFVSSYLLNNLQVIIRIRPLSSSEISLQGHSRCVRQDSSQSITWTGHPESRFTFDLVADENVSQV